MRPHALKTKASPKNSNTIDSAAVRTVEDCLKKNLQALFLAEKQTVQAYHYFMKAAQCEDVQDLFFNSQQSSKVRLRRLENILGRMGEVEAPAGFCATTRALVERAEVVCEQGDGALRDIQIITCSLEIENTLAQKYKTSAEFCETLGQYKMGEL